MNTYTNCLPAWSVGPDCYKEVFSVVRRYGRTAAVVGGKTALSKAYDKLAAALAGTEQIGRASCRERVFRAV